MIEIKIFVEPDSKELAMLHECLSANGFNFNLRAGATEYNVSRFSAPFRIGKKQKRAVLDTNGLEVIVFPKGSEKWAELYCDALNKEVKI